jgi:hypothetical protein
MRSMWDSWKLETPIERVSPRLDVPILLGLRPVDQEEVDVVEPELLQALLQRGDRRVMAVTRVVELGGDEDLVAGEPGCVEGLAHASLVLIHLRGVDVAVASLERLTNHGGRVARGDLPDAETELRNRGPVRESHLGN